VDHNKKSKIFITALGKKSQPKYFEGDRTSPFRKFFERLLARAEL